MARIKQTPAASPGLLSDILDIEVSPNSLPGADVALYAAVTRLAAEKYDDVLGRLTPKLMKESVAKCAAISFVNRRPFEARVLVVDISGRKVTFWMVLELWGPVGGIDTLLRSLLGRLPASSGIRVENGNLVGEVELYREPVKVVSIEGRRATYLLPPEKTDSLEDLAFQVRKTASR